MNLHRKERDNYVLAITAEPELLGDWEASFDNGATWVVGTAITGGWSWLVYGPDFDPDDVGMTAAGTKIERSTLPLLRIKDDPVVDIEFGDEIPPIILHG